LTSLVFPRTIRGDIQRKEALSLPDPFKSRPSVEEAVSLREVRRKSPVPFYGVGAAWVLYALVFPLYRLSNFLIAAAVSAAVYLVLSKVFPGTKELVPEEPPEPVLTGDAAADTLIAEGRETLREIRRLNGEIPDPALSVKIDRVTEVGGKIIAYVGENPAKAGVVRKFMNYYLPTVRDLLRSYEKLDRQEVEGKNITATKENIRKVMDTVVPAFEKQLDALFQDEALDASVDIDVLKSMLAQEGLTEEGFKSTDKPI